MRLMLTAVLLLLPLGLACADTAATLAQADSLNNEGKFLEARTLVLDAAGAATGKDKAELYWRAARETLELGDIAEKAGTPQADVLAIFTEGQGYADKAIAADPGTDLAYYWKSANIGRWGQVKGVLDSLMKAQPMKDLLVKDLSIDPERSDAYFVLGQLYRELPGWPVSFGDMAAAGSLGRKAVDLRQAQVEAGTEQEIVYNFSIELAKTLWKRNWSAATRAKELAGRKAKAASAATPLDKGSYYEATIALKDVSDREEAKSLVQWAVSQLEGMGELTAGQKKDLQKAKDVLKGW
jgi:tetratricopeptide (TPR) repeat protein